MKRKEKITRSQKIKIKARKTLSRKLEKGKKNYVVDTSIIIQQSLPKLIARGLQGGILIPDAVVAELENLANKGSEAGFIGLDEIVNLHQLKKKHKIFISFVGPRPDEKHIKYAKSGEIDALIRNIASKNKATLITADLVQAKSAQAYGIKVLFLRSKIIKKEKKISWLFKKIRKRKTNI